MTKRSFGDAIREGRRHKGVSLRRLAALTGIDYSRLSRIESGTRPAPDLSLVRKLAQALDLDLAGLVVSSGTAREVVDELLWKERLHLASALPDIAAYQPGDSALARKNAFRVSIETREGARCRVRLGRETLTVLSFSGRGDLEIEIPPEAVVVFRADPTPRLDRRENVFAMRVRKLRLLGQVTNLVLEGQGFALNALESPAGSDPLYRVGEDVLVLAPVVAIRTRPARVVEDVQVKEKEHEVE